MLVQLRNKLVADAEGFNVPEGHTKQPFWRGCGGPSESTGRGMQEEIRQELGRPHRLLMVGSAGVGYTAIEARRGNLDTGLCWNLSVGMESRTGRRRVLYKGKLAACLWGVLSSIVL